MEVDFTPSDTGKDTGIGGCRKDLTRSGGLRLAPDQPLQSPKVAISGASTLALTRANLNSVAWPTGVELDQLRCQRSLQWGWQRTIDPEDESARDPRGPALVGRGVLLGANGDHPNQWASI
jgi:hypothetical protein